MGLPFVDDLHHISQITAEFLKAVNITNSKDPALTSDELLYVDYMNHFYVSVAPEYASLLKRKYSFDVLYNCVENESAIDVLLEEGLSLESKNRASLFLWGVSDVALERFEHADKSGVSIKFSHIATSVLLQRYKSLIETAN